MSEQASAEGVASEAKSLGGLSDRACLSRVDQVVDAERRASTFLRVVSGQFTRIILFSDGSVSFACFPDQVVVVVYFSNAGNAQAERDLNAFLNQF